MDVTQVTPAATPPKTSVARAAPTGDFQMFLKMLTAQMKNQDPLKPIDSTDYATQLATFSGVEQQVKTNDLLGAMSGQMGLSGMAQLAPWVGMEARVAAPVEFHGSPITLYPSAAKNADKTVLVAYDAQNHEVSRQALPVSTDPVNWTGTDPTGASLLNGKYSFRLESYQAEKLISTDKVEAFGRIVEARQGDAGAVLVLDSGATVLPSEVRALRPSNAP